MALSKNAKLGIGLTFASIALSITLALTMGSAPAAPPKIKPSKPPKPEPQPQPPPAKPALTTFAGMQGRILEVNVSPGEPAPLIVALHGRDADEDQLSKMLSEGKINGRILLLRGPLQGPKGWRYFDPFFTDSNAILAPAIENAADQVAAAIVEVENKLKTDGTYYGTSVIGYDQGAAIAYALAARDIGGELSSHYVMIAGMLPPSLYPSADNPDRWTNITLAMVHGSADLTISLKEAQATFAAFIGKGPPSPPAAVTTPKIGSFVVEGGTHALATLAPTIQAIIND